MPKITCGVNEIENDRYDGKTVAEVRTELGVILNIPANAKVLINDDEATDESTILENDDEVEFVKAAGEKG